MSFGESPDEAHQDERTKAAMNLAKKSIDDPHKISEGDFEQLNTLFSTEEISTLCSFIGFIIGANKFSLIVGLSENDFKGS